MDFGFRGLYGKVRYRISFLYYLLTIILVVVGGHLTQSLDVIRACFTLCLQ
jgi:hypothetical protein